MNETPNTTGDPEPQKTGFDGDFHGDALHAEHIDVPAPPTQVAHPWQASLRTTVQTIIPLVLALAVAAPVIVAEIPEGVLPDAWLAWLIGAAATVAAAAGALARIMAIPAVERAVRTLGLGTGAEKE